MHTTTYLLLVLLVITLPFSLVRRNYFFVEAQARQHQEDSPAERYEQAELNFPIVDYDEPNLPDTEDNQAKNEKKKRFNQLGNWVSANTQPYIAQNLSTANYFNFPALPVAKSDIILIGVVSGAKAHLSENKRNVFSEFTVATERVLKGSSQEVSEGSVMTVHRMGGKVRYPSGQTVLYRRAGMNMPKLEGRYLFFLNSLNQYDYGILTAYELTETGVFPLDMVSQFSVWEGKSETEILRVLRGLILNTSN